MAKNVKASKAEAEEVEQKPALVDLKFMFCYQNCSVIKEKHYWNILAVLGGSRLNEHIQHIGQGRIEFEKTDTKHENGKFESYPEYKRRYTNCMVFDLSKSPKNHIKKYDKLYLYYNEGHKQPAYGYILHNSKTKKQAHKFMITGDINDLMYALGQTVESLDRAEMLDWYKLRYDSVQCKNGKTPKDCPLDSTRDVIIRKSASWA